MGGWGSGEWPESVCHLVDNQKRSIQSTDKRERHRQAVVLVVHSNLMMHYKRKPRTNTPPAQTAEIKWHARKKYTQGAG